LFGVADGPSGVAPSERLAARCLRSSPYWSPNRGSTPGQLATRTRSSPIRPPGRSSRAPRSLRLSRCIGCRCACRLNQDDRPLPSPWPGGMSFSRYAVEPDTLLNISHPPAKVLAAGWARRPPSDQSILATIVGW